MGATLLSSEGALPGELCYPWSSGVGNVICEVWKGMLCWLWLLKGLGCCAGSRQLGAVLLPVVPGSHQP